jgi:hypothetical protein
MKSSYLSKFTSMIQVAAVGILFIAGRFMLGQAPQNNFDVGGAFLTHVSTDKPIYRTGEKLFVRAVLLRAQDHTPITEFGTASMQVRGPKGDVVTTGSSAITDSVAGFTWEIPEGQAGGEYTVRILHPWSEAPGERKFDIRAYRAARLKSQIVFVRDGYGPGDSVAARLQVERAEGGVPAGARISMSARVDGEEIWKGDTKIDSGGSAAATFKLPSTITRGEGVLAMTIQDGGTVETAAKTIPILLHTVDLAVYPEGGDLVAGLINRVYIEGRTPAQKPADMAGVVVNAKGKEVATFRTAHEGRGRLSFVPDKGESYSLRLSEPAGISKTYPLPIVKDSGVVLASGSNLTPRFEDVMVRLAATASGNFNVALTQRGKELASKRVTLTARQPMDVAFPVATALDGVLTVTVYDERKTPLAERLIFRQPSRRVGLHIRPDRTDYVPGDKVTLRIHTDDETGKPVSATVGLTVTDSSVLEMIDKREQAPRLPVMVLFENDVRNLWDAHVYLNDDDPTAPLATDLLLGTQGWRRFATVDTTRFVAAHGDAARRALAIRTRYSSALGRATTAPMFPDALAPPPPPARFGGVLLGGEYIHGRVADASTALIPGVTVQLTHAATGFVTTTITNDTGNYLFPRVMPGSYAVSASLPGFRTARTGGLQVVNGSFIQQDFILHVSAVNATVEVNIDNGILAMTGATVGEVLPAYAIAQLPLVGNNVLDLINILPGVRNQAVINPDAAGEIRLILNPMDAELRRGNAAIGAISTPMTIREYAHTLLPNRGENTRRDFSETVYWNAAIRTDAAGQAVVSFDLSDSVTSFRIMADGFTQEGALGSSLSQVESVQPFSVEPKLPLQVTSGDVIQLPVTLINGTSRDLRGTEVSLNAGDGFKVTKVDGASSTLRSKQRARNLIQLEVGREAVGSNSLTFDAKAGGYRDTVTRKIDVQPMGFPHESSAGGTLETNSSRTVEFSLPQEMVPGSASSIVTVYPTPLASMTEALKALIREPHGCFEQTSATSYPMVMAQQYFLTHSGVEPALIERTRTLLDSAYTKLLGFQSRNHGFEWFGNDPGHEALTAYGLMQFTDMARVRSVDKDMLSRTRSWLLSRRDDKDGFSVNPNAVDSFGRAPANTTNAYIVWALIEAGEKGLDKEIAALKASAMSSQDSYVIALVANILQSTGDRAGARQLMGRLAGNQSSSGSVQGAVTSITRSGGDALHIETTALAVLAWMKDSAHSANADKALRWIAESNKAGRFGSTQSTILALRSIVAYDSANARTKAPGRIQLIVDGKTAGAPVAFTADSQQAIMLPEFAGDLGPGRHSVVLKMEGGSKMPYSVAVKYSSTLPDSAEQAQVLIQVALRDSQLREGDVTEASVSITNRNGQAIPTPVAIIGIPGGLEVRHDQLKDLVKAGRIDAYEVMGREVVLYWRYIKANAQFDVPLSLVAAIPGTYTGPASRAYLYYTDEYKSWSAGVRVRIMAR